MEVTPATASSFAALPSTLPELRRLTVRGGVLEADFEPFSASGALTHLELCGCDQLAALHGLAAHLPLLRHLRLQAVPRLGMRALAAVTRLAALTELTIEMAGVPLQLTHLSGLASLRALDLTFFDYKPTLSALVQLTSLSLPVQVRRRHITPPARPPPARPPPLLLCASLSDLLSPARRLPRRR